MDQPQIETGMNYLETVYSETEQMKQFALEQHSAFDSKWNKPSYHNEKHIQGFLDAADTVFTGLFESAGQNDPFALADDLRAWNNVHPKYQIDDLDMLHEAVLWAVAGHDLGNISSDDEPNADGSFTHAEYYRGKGSELRSIEITDARMKNRLPKNQRTLAMRKLVRHLIKQTILDDKISDVSVPFRRFMQVLDQSGAAYFSDMTNEDVTIGLVYEALGQENKSERVFPEFMTMSGTLGFNNGRIVKSFPDMYEREKVYELFEQNTHGHTRHDFEMHPSLTQFNELEVLPHYELAVSRLKIISDLRKLQTDPTPGGIL